LFLFVKEIKKDTSHTDLYNRNYFLVRKANSGSQLDTTCVYMGRSDGEIHTSKMAHSSSKI